MASAWTAPSLEDAIKDSKVAVADVTSIELVSGEITQNDLAYLAQITNLEKFTMHLGEDLILHGKDGNPTTVLGPNTGGTELCTEGIRKQQGRTERSAPGRCDGDSEGRNRK